MSSESTVSEIDPIEGKGVKEIINICLYTGICLSSGSNGTGLGLNYQLGLKGAATLGSFWVGSFGLLGKLDLVHIPSFWAQHFVCLGWVGSDLFNREAYMYFENELKLSLVFLYIGLDLVLKLRVGPTYPDQWMLVFYGVDLFFQKLEVSLYAVVILRGRPLFFSFFLFFVFVMYMWAPNSYAFIYHFFSWWGKYWHIRPHQSHTLAREWSLLGSDKYSHTHPTSVPHFSSQGIIPFGGGFSPLRYNGLAIVNFFINHFSYLIFRFYNMLLSEKSLSRNYCLRELLGIFEVDGHFGL